MNKLDKRKAINKIKVKYDEDITKLISDPYLEINRQRLYAQAFARINAIITHRDAPSKDTLDKDKG